MPKEFGRNLRFAKLLQRELALLIQRQYPISEHGIITITAVDVSADLKNAKVFITCLDEGSGKAGLLDLLNKDAVFLRTQIARTLFAKRVPVIQFKYDKSIAQGMRLFSLLNSSSTKKEKIAG